MSFRYLRPLRIASVVFLSIPWFIFLVTWLRPGWAVLLVPLQAYLLVLYIARTSEPASVPAADLLPTRDRISAGALLVIIIAALVWTSLSGAGGVGYQNLPDWDNKNAMMNDLVQYPWPIGYPGGQVLNFYLALYLPAAVLGRLAGWNAGQWLLYGEVLAGTVLALLWVFSFSGRLGAAACLLFLAFGGLDIVGSLLATHNWPGSGIGIEWWSRPLQFSGNTTLLFWVPQHSLPGWLLGALLLDEGARWRRFTFAGLLVGLCVLWSPLTTLGLIPAAIAGLAMADRRTLVSPANLLYGPLILVLAVAFYAPHRAGAVIDVGAVAWQRHYSASGIARTGLFLALEVGAYLVAIAACWKLLERPWRVIAIIVAISSLACVVLPPIMANGNFAMRMSIPTLLMLFLLVVRILWLEAPGGIRVGLVLCLALGAVSAVQEVTRSIMLYPAALPAPRPAYGVPGLRPRHRTAMMMPADWPIYQLFFRPPAPPAAAL